MTKIETEGLTEKRNKAGTRYFVDDDNDIIAKKCTKCGDVKSMNEFSSCRGKLGDKQPKCKSCERQYRQENKERRNEYDRQYRQENKERIKERGRQYYRENKERIRQYQQENKERIRERDRQYRQENKEMYLLHVHTRRARKQHLPDTLTENQRNQTMAHFNIGCALTGETESYHMDHVIPLSIGHGGTTFENMIPLRDNLNISKGNRNLFEWFRGSKEFYELSQTKFDELIEYLADINGMSTDEYEEYVYWCHDNPQELEEEDAKEVIGA